MNNLIRSASKNPVIPADTQILPHADFALIYGNKFIIPELARTAARLYTSGTTSTIVVTGGVHARPNRTEAEELYAALRYLGIPKRAIIVENHSTNTEENITHTKKIIDDRFGLENIDAIVGIGHAYAGPRFLMTLSRHWPSALPMHISVFPDGITADNWQDHKQFAARAFNEAAKLPLYARMNYINPILPEDVNNIITSHIVDHGTSLALKAS